jgi:hypothetical protein
MAGKDKARMQRSITQALSILVIITMLVRIAFYIESKLFRGIQKYIVD